MEFIIHQPLVPKQVLNMDQPFRIGLNWLAKRYEGLISDRFIITEKWWFLNPTTMLAS